MDPNVAQHRTSQSGSVRRKRRTSTSSSVASVTQSAPGHTLAHRRELNGSSFDSWTTGSTSGHDERWSPRNKHRRRQTIFGAFLIDPLFYCRMFAIGILVFVIMAGIGAVLQLGSPDGQKLAHHIRVEGIVDDSALGDEVNWKVAQEAVSLALATSWLALKLWVRLLLSIILPTSQRSWIITKEGWTALQPSLRQTAIWFLNTDPLTKAAIFTAIAIVVTALMLEREIRRRRYLERAQDQYARYLRRFERRYGQLRTEVERQSRFAAQLLPHALFALLAGALWALLPSLFHIVAAGFYGWGIAVAFPVVAAARALMVYEDKRRRRMEDRLRRSRSESGLAADHPMSLSRAHGYMGYMRSVWSNLRQRMATSTEGVLFLDDGGAEEDPERVIEEYRQLRSVVKWLRYWTVMGVAMLMEQLPMTGHVIEMIPVWPEIRLVYSLWLQIPGTHGSDLAFTAVVPIISKYFKRVRAPETRQSQNLLLNFLFAMGIIDSSMRGRLVEVFDTGGTLIMISVPFLFTPSFVTNVGILLVGLGYPIYSSAVCLLTVQSAVKDARAAKAEAGRRTSKQRGRGSTGRRTGSISALMGGTQCALWLEYWVVYSLFAMAQSYISWLVGWFIPLWTHMILLGTMWLQLPYFRGAHAIFKVANDLVEQWRKRSEMPDIQEEDESGEEAKVEEAPTAEEATKALSSTASWASWFSTPTDANDRSRPQSARSHRSKRSKSNASVQGRARLSTRFEDDEQGQVEDEQSDQDVEMKSASNEEESSSVMDESDTSQNTTGDDEMEISEDESFADEDDAAKDSAERSKESVSQQPPNNAVEEESMSPRSFFSFFGRSKPKTGRSPSI